MKKTKEKQRKEDRMFLDIAKIIANQSKCVSFKIGAVLVKEGRIISTGYNGTPSGFINCNDKFDKYNFNREEHHIWSNKFTIHAEMNCLLYGAKMGIKTKDTTLYCTHQPCHNCLKHVIQAGVIRVVYEEDYDKSDYTKETEDLIKILNLKFEKF